MTLPKYPTLKERRAAQKPGKLCDNWDEFPDISLGRLTLLTPERIVEAAKLIQTGDTINLDWPLHKPLGGCFGRGELKHEIQKRGRMAVDDYIHVNTQTGSQWDGLAHFAHQNTQAFYGGVTLDQIDVPLDQRKGGMSAWAERGGIVGRGVFLDIYGYKLSRGEDYDPFTSFSLTIDDILGCAKAQNVTFQKGDIFIYRSGFTATHDKADKARLDRMRKELKFVGLQQSEEVLEFLQDNYFAAVASDAPSFECMPPQTDWWLHEYLLSAWGVPIGEFWDLEGLAEKCKSLNRYEFFLTSKVLNIVGGIASPPNAIAIF